MRPAYYKKDNVIELKCEFCSQFPAHLHSAMECVYVASGSVQLGIGETVYHLDAGDFAIVFPDLIHYGFVYEDVEAVAFYIIAPLALSGPFLETMQHYCPKNPVIRNKDLHPDILTAFNGLFTFPAKEYKEIIRSSWLNLILARTLPFYEMQEKKSAGSNDIIYEAVSYVSENFKEHISLTEMARNLGYSPYALSRVFSSVFHRNFNQYINDTRLDYASKLLRNTDDPITEISEDSGFESLRTFNRVFKERYGLSPRDFRKTTEKPIEREALLQPLEKETVL